MSWRRFTALLRGLGPYSATVSRAHINRAEGRRGKVVSVETPEQANRMFDTLFRPPSSGRTN